MGINSTFQMALSISKVILLDAYSQIQVEYHYFILNIISIP